MTHIYGLSDKEFKITIITMLRDQLETCMKEKKKKESLSKEDRSDRENQIEILELKNNQENNRKKKLIGLAQYRIYMTMDSTNEIEDRNTTKYPI